MVVAGKGRRARPVAADGPVETEGALEASSGVSGAALSRVQSDRSRVTGAAGSAEKATQRSLGTAEKRAQRAARRGGAGVAVGGRRKEAVGSQSSLLAADTVGINSAVSGTKAPITSGSRGLLGRGE